MADNRKPYEVQINGVPHTLLLSPDDYEARKKSDPDSIKAAPAPSNKSRSAGANK